MWSPHPKGKIIRRPQPDFSHRRPRVLRRPPPQELADAQPDPRRNYKYFGIQRSDVTDYLKHQVPSHAFHPSLVGTPPPVTSGRCPRSKQKRRPETAPAAIAWFGRNCSDVSDWLRYRPPAHLGLDPDDKPLPHYPTTSSIVTDAKWQTREFPALPNILWHWWAERPSSVPLATNPQHVKEDTLVDAVKHRIVRPRGPYTPASDATPRSAGSQTPRSGCGTPRSVAAAVPAAKLPGEFTPRPGSVPSGASTPRVCSGPSGASTPRPGTAPSEIGTPRSGGYAEASPRVPGTPRLGGCADGSPRVPGTPRSDGCAEVSPRVPTTPRPGSAAESVRSGTPTGSRDPSAPCGNFPDTPRSMCSAGAGVARAHMAGTPQPSPRVFKAGGAAVKCNGHSAWPASGPSPRSANCNGQSAWPAQGPSPRSERCNWQSPCAAQDPSPRSAKSNAQPPCTGPDPSPRSARCSWQSPCAASDPSPRSAKSNGQPPCTAPDPIPRSGKCSGQSLCTASYPSPRSGKCNGQSPCIAPDPSPRSAGRVNVTTSHKPLSPGVSASGRPPPSPRHPNPPHVPRQAAPPKVCSRHPAAVPSGLYVQGRGHGHASSNGRDDCNISPRTAFGKDCSLATLDELRVMSPDAFATKLAWAEKFNKHAQGSCPWPPDEKKARKVIEAY